MDARQARTGGRVPHVSPRARASRGKRDVQELSRHARRGAKPHGLADRGVSKASLARTARIRVSARTAERCGRGPMRDVSHARELYAMPCERREASRHRATRQRHPRGRAHARPRRGVPDTGESHATGVGAGTRRTRGEGRSGLRQLSHTGELPVLSHWCEGRGSDRAALTTRDTGQPTRDDRRRTVAKSGSSAGFRQSSQVDGGKRPTRLPRVP